MGASVRRAWMSSTASVSSIWKKQTLRHLDGRPFKEPCVSSPQGANNQHLQDEGVLLAVREVQFRHFVWALRVRSEEPGSLPWLWDGGAHHFLSQLLQGRGEGGGNEWQKMSQWTDSGSRPPVLMAHRGHSQVTDLLHRHIYRVLIKYRSGRVKQWGRGGKHTRTRPLKHTHTHAYVQWWEMLNMTLHWNKSNESAVARSRRPSLEWVKSSSAAKRPQSRVVTSHSKGAVVRWLIRCLIMPVVPHS